MKWFLLFLILLLAQSAFAEEIGRYQAVTFPKVGQYDAKEIIILDTKDGHIWTWSEWSTIEGIRQGGRSLIYQGRVKPAKKIGDIIEWQVFKPESAK